MNNAEVQHIFNQEALSNAVAAAMAGWVEKNANHSLEEKDAAEDRIRLNIIQSRTKDKFLNSKANRAARRAHIAEEVAKHGMKFTTATDLAEVSDKLEMTEEEFQASKTPFLAILMEEIVNLLDLKKQVERAVTFCFKTEDIGYNTIGFKVSASFQNPSDDPDSLVAREYALARFLEDKVFAFSVPVTLVEQFGAETIVRDLVNSNFQSIYTAKYL